MSLLTVARKQKIHIALYYQIRTSQDGSASVVVLTDEKGKELLESEKSLPADKKTVEVLNTYWKVLTWRDANLITQRSKVINPQGMQDLDFFNYRDIRLKTAMVGWDMKDENGRDVPYSPENIDSLPDNIVFELIRRYEALVSLSAQDEKK